MVTLLLLWSLFKLLLVCLAILLAYLFNMYIIMPYFVRAKYRRYRNVAQSKDFQFMKVDIVEIEANARRNAFLYWHYAELAAYGEHHPDIYLKFTGPTSMFLMFSPKALHEFKKLQPEKIDRDSYFINRVVGKFFYKSLLQEKSTEHWKDRRNTAMKTLGINFASRYISTLVDSLDACVKKWKVGEKFDFTAAFCETQFQFTSQMMFGKDFNLNNLEFHYHNESGQLETVNMHTIFNKIKMDTYAGFLKPIGVMFPFLNDYNIAPTYRRIMRNVRELEKGLRAFLATTTDSESYYSQIKNMNKYTDDEIVADLILMLFAGSDTTAHATVSMLYFIKKHPEIKDKCQQAYEKIGIITKDGLDRSKLTMNNFEQCEYPEFVIKETLRIDHTAPETVAYEALDNIDICGVPIIKGSILSINLFGFHYNPNEWHEPLKFIPERFDPESEYFTAPATGKARDPLSFVPFSAGLRSCPGQTMARLVQKVALPYFIANIDYDVDQELLSNDKILFNNNSQFHLLMTLTAKRV